MKLNEMIKELHWRTAQISVGPSAIRNVGASGIIEKCRNYFYEEIKLEEFRKYLDTPKYKNYLDKCTNELCNTFPKEVRYYGVARKSLNLFFREIVYNFYLANHLNISIDSKSNKEQLKYLEIPLDSFVAMGLSEKFSSLPKWTTIKNADEKLSLIYQEKAFELAIEYDTARIHLDLKFWRNVKYQKR